MLVAMLGVPQLLLDESVTHHPGAIKSAEFGMRCGRKQVLYINYQLDALHMHELPFCSNLIRRAQKAAVPISLVG